MRRLLSLRMHDFRLIVASHSLLSRLRTLHSSFHDFPAVSVRQQARQTRGSQLQSLCRHDVRPQLSIEMSAGEGAHAFLLRKCTISALLQISNFKSSCCEVAKVVAKEAERFHSDRSLLLPVPHIFTENRSITFIA